MELNVEQSDDNCQNCLDPEKCRLFKGNALADLKVRLCNKIELFVMCNIMTYFYFITFLYFFINFRAYLSL